MTERARLIGLERINPAQLDRWADAAARSSRCPEADPRYSQLLAAAGEQILVWNTSTAWCPLVRAGNIFTAVCPRDPVIAETPSSRRILDVAHTIDMAGACAYFPLVEHAVAESAHEYGSRTWPRRGNPVIDWRGRTESMFERAMQRGTSQVARKRRRLEAGGYQLTTKEKGPEAARRMLTVDRRSWKSTQGQGMEQRGSQARFYSALLSQGLATASFVNFGGEPVAFRLDVLVADTLSCLKWSYDKDHGRVSPGLYLLTTGLDIEWGDSAVHTVDLHGGPDSLKRLVQTRVEDRFDVWVGDSGRGDELRADRLGIDEAVAIATNEGRGLRHAY